MEDEELKEHRKKALESMKTLAKNQSEMIRGLRKRIQEQNAIIIRLERENRIFKEKIEKWKN